MPTWLEIMRVGGFDPSAANWGAYAGLVHGIASRPKPKRPSKPAAGGPQQPQPPNPRDAFTTALGTIRPTLDTQGTVCGVRSNIDLGKFSSVDLAKPPPRTLECRLNTCLEGR